MAKMSTVKKQAVIQSTIKNLDELIVRRNQWQVDYDRTNKGLYALLSECLRVYNGFKGTAAEKDVLETISSNLVDRGIKIQTSTPVLTLLVRYVFNAERRRAFVYANAIAVAVNSKIKPEDFAAWVEKFGGIEEVVKQNSYNEETAKKRAELASKVNEVKDLLVRQVRTPLALVPQTSIINPAKTGEYTLLIGKTQANGETIVLSVVPDASEAMIESAIVKIAQALINHFSEAQYAVAQRERDDTMNDAITEGQQSFAEAA